MTDTDLNSIFDKVKATTKRVADAAGRQAKLTQLRIRLMTLHGTRNQHMQNIGSSMFGFYKDGNKFDQTSFSSFFKDEIAAIEELDRQAGAIEAQIQAHEENAVKVKDITPQ